MAVAKLVSKVERSVLDWLEITDEDGAVYRYGKRDVVRNPATIHVAYDDRPLPAIRAKLVRDEKGNAVLRQDGPGLPAKIIVDWREAGKLPTAAAFVGTYEYEQEQP